MITIRNNNYHLAFNSLQYSPNPNKRFYFLLQDFHVPYLYWGVSDVL